MLRPEAAGINLFFSVSVVEREKINIKYRWIFFDYGVVSKAFFNKSVNNQLGSVADSANKVNLKQTPISVLK